MCGRFAFFLPPAELFRLFGCINLVNFPARYNAAPMQDHPVIIRNRMGLARWGLSPPWLGSDDKTIAAKMINARFETIADKPTCRESWRRARRCLVPANGFYEWYGPEGDTTPYYIYRPDDAIMAMAGLWAKRDNLVTFTVLTREADGPIRQFHDRMPVIFDPEQAKAWFTANEDQAMQMIRQVSINDLSWHAVARDVGKVANDSAALITPAERIPTRLF